jgi:hypothetical protein
MCSSCGCVASWRKFTTDIDIELERDGNSVKRADGETMGTVRLASGKELDVMSIYKDRYAHVVYLRSVDGSIVGSVRANPKILQWFGYDAFAPQRPLATVRDSENKIKLPYGNCIQRGIALAARM